MPPVHNQSVQVIDQNNIRIVLDTSVFGVLVITASRSGGSVTLTATRDGVQLNSTTLNNPTAAAFEQWCRDAFGGVLNIQAGGLTIETIQFRIHVISLNPLQVSIASFNHNVSVPSNWWLTGG